MTKLYEKFLIYKAILNKVSLTAISEKLNISRNVIYKVKKEGLIKIKDKERIVLNFIEKDPFKNIDEIALETNLNKIFIYRTLKKYGIITFKQPSKKILEIIEFLINEKNYNELKKLLTFQFLIPYKVFKNLETDDLELKFYKLGYDIYHSQKSSDELLSEIESYLNELKSQNKIFTFYKALILKIDVLILKKCFDEIIEIYNENIEHLISLSLRVMFYRAFSNAYSFKEDFKKAFYFIKKIKKVHKKLKKSEKIENLKFFIALLYNYGNFKLCYKLSRKYHLKLFELMSAYSMGNYEDVINENVNLESKFEKFIISYIKSMSLLMSFQFDKAIKIISDAYKELEFQNFEDFIEYYYIFLTIYNKLLENENYKLYFQEMKNILNDKMDKHFYAIVSGDISNLDKSPKDMVIKYWIKGYLHKAINVSQRYGIITILYILNIFHPKSFSKLKRYRIFELFNKFSKKEKIKVFLLRKKPYFVFRNKKHYLKDKGLSVALIKLFCNKYLNFFEISKRDYKRIAYELKIPILKEENRILLNAQVYIDLDEAELHFNTKNFRKLKRLFKSLPFNLNFHTNNFLNNIIQRALRIKPPIE